MIVKHFTEEGFTLIEVMIALIVLAVGILTLSSMQIAAIRGNSTANGLTVATIAVNDVYERLLNITYDNASLTDGAAYNEAEFADLQLPGTVTSISWNIKEGTTTDGVDDDGDGTVDESDEAGIKFVSITVNYTDRTEAKSQTVNFYKHELM